VCLGIFSKLLEDLLKIRAQRTINKPLASLLSTKETIVDQYNEIPEKTGKLHQSH
jgi:hypothetical protein